MCDGKQQSTQLNFSFPVFDPAEHDDEDLGYDYLQRGREYTIYSRSMFYSRRSSTSDDDNQDKIDDKVGERSGGNDSDVSGSDAEVDQSIPGPVSTEPLSTAAPKGPICTDCLSITVDPYSTSRLMSRTFSLRWKPCWASLEASAAQCPCCAFIKQRLEAEALRAPRMSVPESAALLIQSVGQGMFVPTRDGTCGSIAVKYDTRFYGNYFINPVWLSVSTDYDSQAATDPGIVCRKPARNSGSVQSFEWIKTQMTRCRKAHTCCSISDSTTLPTRIVYVGARVDSTNPQLVITNGQKAAYTALSHCWGPETAPFFKLTQAMISPFQEQIDFNTLPKNFQDAIHVTRALGIDYIWIDALCIVQDDISDWASEAPKMASVYSQAALTIVASSAASCHDGFLKERPETDSDSVELPYESSLTSKPSHVYLKPEETVEDQLDAHLAQPVQDRAWCLQERLLSTRVIHFDRNQLVWQCRRGLLLESRIEFISNERMELKSLSSNSNLNGLSLLQSSQSMPIRSREAQNIALAAWYRIVDIYATKLLTSPADVLPAFAGLAEHFEGLSLGSYLAGVWTYEIIGQLLWTMREMSTYDLTQSTLLQLDNTFAPSWSWASKIAICNGEGLTFRSDPSLGDFPEERTYLSKYISCDLNPRFPNTGCKGQMKSARLLLEGPTKLISILHGARDILGGPHIPCSSNDGNDWHQWVADLDPDFQHRCNAVCTWNGGPILTATNLVHCNQLNGFMFLLLEKDRNWRGLILQSVRRKDGNDVIDDEEVFRRVGVFDHQPKAEYRLPGNSKKSSDEAMNGWSSRRVILV